jgi:ABC-type dipeptide/oligopeptide/nickel transport system permease subunit
LTSLAEPIGSPQAESAISGRSPRQLFWARIRRDRAALGSVAFLCLVGLAAVFAGLVSKHVVGHGPNDLFQQEMLDEFGVPKGPNSDFWFGADSSGRDVFVRVLYGARTSLLIAVVATGLAVVIGTVLGMIAGYVRGFTDTLISRFVEILLAMPVLLFAIGIVASCGTTKEGCLGGLVQPGRALVIFVIALFTWPYIARLVRGSMLSLREREFIEASRSLGAGNVRIMVREILPNLAAPIIIYATLLIPSNILFEAGLSFLGLGVPETTPSWGQMLADASNSGLYEVAWWLMLFPGLFLLGTTLAFNLLGDGLRDALDPRFAR